MNIKISELPLASGGISGDEITLIVKNGVTSIVPLSAIDGSTNISLSSVALSGISTAPTASFGNNSQQIANTNFVQTAVTSLSSNTLTSLSLKVDKTTTINGQSLSANVVISSTEDNLSDLSKGKHRLPLTVSRAYPVGNTPDDNPILSVLILGDSLTQGLQYPSILQHMRFQGYKLMPFDFSTVVSGSAPAVVDNNWLANRHRALAQNTVVEWVPQLFHQGGTYANRIGVTYIKGATSAETFSLQYSVNNGSSWITASNIDSSLTTNRIEFAQFNVDGGGASGAVRTRVRVVTSSGQSAKIVGLGAWFGDNGNYAGQGGYALIVANRGGLEANTIAALPANEISRPFAAMKITTVIGSWNDHPSNFEVNGNFDTIRAAANAGQVADWVMVTPPRSGPTINPSTGLSVDQSAGQTRDAMIAWAERTNQNVIDAYPMWRSWQHAVSMGYMGVGDEVHPTIKGEESRASLISNLLREHLPQLRNQLSISDPKSGRDTALYQTPYSVILGQPATQTFSGPFIVDLGAGTGIALRSQTTGSLSKALNWYFSGETGGGGVTTEWFANDGSTFGSGSNRSLQKLTSVGGTSSNMSRTSDWPIVETLKAATTPPTPPAGQITTFARLNGGGKMEYCMVTPSGVVVVMGVQP